MSKKTTIILTLIATTIFILASAFYTNQNILAGRRTYASQEEMQAALQDTFVYHTSHGKNMAWKIQGNTATRFYPDGTTFDYTITKWNPGRGILKICLNTTTETEQLYVSKGGALYNERREFFQPQYTASYGETCQYEDCGEAVALNRFFCSKYACSHADCNLKVVKGSSYCVRHTCQKGTEGCYNRVDQYGQKCDSCQNPKKYSTPTYAAPIYQHTPSKHYKEEMPDCDDYESYEDFMDDWDGNMPDGSDAEDYWGNW